MNVSTQQFKDAYAKLPYILREYISDDELSGISEEIGAKYGFHIDTIGALYREATNMLAGIENPEQFSGELRSIGVPAEQIPLVIQELNERVFMPLRERMQKEGDYDPYKESAELSRELDGENNSPVETMPIAPAPVPTAELRASVMPAALPERSPNLLASTPSYAQPTQAAPASVSQFAPNNAFPQPKAPITAAFGSEANVPVVRTMAVDMAAVKGGKAPHAEPAANWDPLAAPRNDTATPYTPGFRPTYAAASTPESKPVPAAAAIPPAPAMPSPMSALVAPVAPVPAPQPAPVPLPPTPAAPTVAPLSGALPRTPNQQDLHDTLKSYGVDPYREPFQ